MNDWNNSSQKIAIAGEIGTIHRIVRKKHNSLYPTLHELENGVACEIKEIQWFAKIFFTQEKDKDQIRHRYFFNQFMTYMECSIQC